MTAVTDDPRELKLPKWVRTELNRLRQRVTFLQQEIDDAKAGIDPATNVWANVYGTYPKAVGVNERVRFVVDQDNWLDVRHGEKHGTYEIHASSGVAILPNVSNTITLEVRER